MLVSVGIVEKALPLDSSCLLAPVVNLGELAMPLEGPQYCSAGDGIGLGELVPLCSRLCLGSPHLMDSSVDVGRKRLIIPWGHWTLGICPCSSEFMDNTKWICFWWWGHGGGGQTWEDGKVSTIRVHDSPNNQ